MGTNDDTRIEREQEAQGYKEITVQLYRFGNLNDKARARAIQWMKDCESEDNTWAECGLEEWPAKLDALGFANTKIMYSGFWSQGDGACFTADIEIEKYIRAHKLGNKFRALLNEAKAGNVGGSITHSWRYYFAASTNVSIDYQGGNDAPAGVFKQIDDLDLLIEKERENLGNEIYKELEDAYEDFTSDEHCKETIEANDYWFNEAGEVVTV